MFISFFSLYSGDYFPSSGTVIGALKNDLGINVMKMSDNKELDLRQHFSCWISKPLDGPYSSFSRLLCFEKNV